MVTKHDESNAPGFSSRATISLAWQNISVNINKATGKQILDHAVGCARRGRILALMGPAGSGKSTLMTVLSGRLLNRPMTFDSSKAQIHLNGHEVDNHRALLDQCGYVEQVAELGDFIQSISVQEYLVFQTMLGMPSNVSDVDRYKTISSVLRRLNLINCEHTLIGRLSGGESKRVSLAYCLLMSPSILLFDDCNSGLDSHLALTLLKYIRSLNVTAVVVLHQPSTRLMCAVDDLCLLGFGGRTIYVGPRDQALSVFLLPCPADVHLGEFCINQAAQARPTNPVVSTVEYERILQDQLSLANHEIDNRISIDKFRATYQASFFCQVRWLIWRSVSLRDTKRHASKLALSLVVALMYGLLSFGLEWHRIDQRTVQNMSGLISRVLMIITRTCSLLIISALFIDHALIERESCQQKLYSIGAYYLAKFLSDSPLFIMIAWLFTTIIIVLTGLKHYFIMCLIVTMTCLCEAGMGCLMCSVFRQKEARIVIWQPLTQISSSLSGMFINSRSIPFFVKWLQVFSSIYYGFTLSLITQWSSIDHIECSSHGSNATEDRCYRSGADVLHAYDIIGHSTLFYWSRFVALLFGVHLVSYGVLVLRTRTGHK